MDGFDFKRYPIRITSYHHLGIKNITGLILYYIQTYSLIDSFAWCSYGSQNMGFNHQYVRWNAAYGAMIFTKEMNDVFSIRQIESGAS